MEKVTLKKPSVSNTGPFWIGRSPDDLGVPEAGYDNFQVHNRALTLDEVKLASAGNIIYNKNLVIAYDFNEGIVDRKIKDLSSYGHHANVWQNTPV